MTWEVKAIFQASMTGRKMEPLTEVVLGQVNVPIRQLGLKCQGASKLKTPNSKWTGRRGKGKKSCNMNLELHLGSERKGSDLGEDSLLGAGEIGEEIQVERSLQGPCPECPTMESGTSRETGHSMLTQSSTHCLHDRGPCSCCVARESHAFILHTDGRVD